MGADTKIEWAHHTFNPWEGCQKVGPGCDHCYAEARNVRFGGGTAPNWGAGAPRRRTSPNNWKRPRHWNAAAMAAGERHRVFCSSLADVFDNAVDPLWRKHLAVIIRETPALDWLLLTKRIGNAAEMLDDMFNGVMPANVWIGATIVNQAEADRDIPKLLVTPAAKRFLSMEPLLGPVLIWKDEIIDAAEALPGFRDQDGDVAGIDWVIVGGESGHGARPMHPDWARSLRGQCIVASVPFLFKQWGEWLPGPQYQWAPEAKAADPRLEQSRFDCMDWDGKQFEETGGGWMDDLSDEAVFRVGKHRAGRLLDGVLHDGVPA